MDSDWGQNSSRLQELSFLPQRAARSVGELLDHAPKAEWAMAFITRNAPEFLFLAACSILLAGVVYLFGVGH